MGIDHHLWTVLPRLRAGFRPPAAPPDAPWSTSFEGDLGTVTLRGRLAVPAKAAVRANGEAARDGLAVLVHGLGGSAGSDYMVRAAAAAHDAGIASLRVSLRGADGSGDDLYHAGLDRDIARILADPSLERFARIGILGFSLGGHVALRAATSDGLDARVTRVAAVCSPLDLAAAQRGIDRPVAKLYRAYVLRRLRGLYARVHERHPALPGDPSRVADARTLRDFDAAAVVPRFGFADVDDYYRRASVGPRLGRLRVRAMLVAVREDPMVRRDSIEPWSHEPGLDIRWLDRGGHVHVPPKVELGLGPAAPLEHQLVEWMLG